MLCSIRYLLIAVSNLLNCSGRCSHGSSSLLGHVQLRPMNSSMFFDTTTCTAGTRSVLHPRGILTCYLLRKVGPLFHALCCYTVHPTHVLFWRCSSFHVPLFKRVNVLVCALHGCVTCIFRQSAPLNWSHTVSLFIIRLAFTFFLS